jgi:hypothetical protein
MGGYNASDWREVYFRNGPSKVGWKKADLERALVDPAWHKAVFYREPMARFLSGFKSKCEPGHDSDRLHCEDAFGKIDPTIREALTQLAWKDRRKPGRQQETNAHFARQARFCGGLDTTLDHYNTVELLEKHTARDKVTTMLKAVGVDASKVPEFDRLFPDPAASVLVAAKSMRTSHQRTAAAAAAAAVGFNQGEGHITNSELQLRKYLKNPEEIVTLLEHYVEDYLLFGIKAPRWATTFIADRPSHVSAMYLPRPWRSLEKKDADG